MKFIWMLAISIKTSCTLLTFYSKIKYSPPSKTIPPTTEVKVKVKVKVNTVNYYSTAIRIQ